MAGFTYSFATLSRTGKVTKHTVNITDLKEAPPGAPPAMEAKVVEKETRVKLRQNSVVPGGGLKS